MFETVIQFKPRDQWRPGMTPGETDRGARPHVKLPGLANVWVPPIRNRIDMLATGIKSPIGVKVSGSDLAASIDRRAMPSRRSRKTVPGVSSASPNGSPAGAMSMSTSTAPPLRATGSMSTDVQASSRARSAARTIGETSMGWRAIRSIVRYPRELRDSLERLRALPVVTPSGSSLTLGTVATRRDCRWAADAPQRERRPSTWVYVDVRGRDLASVVGDLQRAVAAAGQAAAGRQRRLFRAVRISRTRGRAAEDRWPRDVGHHLPSALRHLPAASMKRRSSWRRCRSR
jgi:Cu(I)/Ag(I) efflux system membrane protein CusA/SilA